jgi:acetyltransferase
MPEPAPSASRPYPQQYVGAFTLRDGTAVEIRPIRPEDEPLMVRFHEALSEQSVYLRYFGALKLSRRTAHERLAPLCFLDYDREMALVAVRRDGEGLEELLGVGRLAKLPGTSDGEFALLVRDDVQGQGLGSELLRRLVEVGRAEGLARLVGEILPENEPMLAVARALGFRIVRDPEVPVVRSIRTLS